MATLAPVIQKALRGSEVESRLTEEEYQGRLRQLKHIVELDYQAALQDTINRKRQEAIAAGQPPTVVIDVKVAELEVLKQKETAILEEGNLIARQGKQDDFRALFDSLRPLFNVFPKARMAKITRMIIDVVPKMSNSANLQIDLCQSCIEWCSEEKRTFLRHRIQTKLASLYEQQNQVQAGLQLVGPLLSEVKKVDDKLLLVEVHLVEAKLNFNIRHIPKAKAALTASKTNANAIHCPPMLQASIDLVAGCLHAEEKDFRTAYSYFYEAFEAYNLQNDDRAVQALKYMMLSRIMSDQAENITHIGRGTTGLKYLELDEIKCVIEIAKAYAKRSLEDFESAILKHRTLIQSDALLARHIDQAAEQLLEQSITKLVQPYSEVEIAYIAHKCRLPLDRVQSKLCEMILDHKVAGTLDQGRGVFIIFQDSPPKQVYEDSVSTFSELTEIVELLSEKIQKVM